jgi:hypothetical protein
MMKFKKSSLDLASSSSSPAHSFKNSNNTAGSIAVGVLSTEEKKRKQGVGASHSSLASFVRRSQLNASIWMEEKGVPLPIFLTGDGSSLLPTTTSSTTSTFTNRKRETARPKSHHQHHHHHHHGGGGGAGAWHVKMPKQILVYTLAVFLVGPLVLFFWKETHLHGHDHHHHPDEVLLKSHHLRQHEAYATWMEEDGQGQPPPLPPQQESDEALKSANTKTTSTSTIPAAALTDADSSAQLATSGAMGAGAVAAAADVDPVGTLNQALDFTATTTLVETQNNTSSSTKSPDDIDKASAAAETTASVREIDYDTATDEHHEQEAGEEEEEIEDANLVALPLQPLDNTNRIPSGDKAALLGDDNENDLAQEEGDTTIQREAAAADATGTINIINNNNKSNQKQQLGLNKRPSKIIIVPDNAAANTVGGDAGAGAGAGAAGDSETHSEE